MSKILSVSTAGCFTVDKYSPIPGYVETTPASRNYENGFGTDLMLKDLRLAIDVAQASKTTTKLGTTSM